VTGIDFRQLSRSYDVTGRIWLNGSPVPSTTRVAVTADGHECWTAQTNRSDTAAGVPVSFYFASLLPSSDPGCQGGDLEISIDGQPAGLRTPWNQFWRDSLFSSLPRPLNGSADLALPPFLGISGQVVEASTVYSRDGDPA
jgi:hypothetical protein